MVADLVAFAGQPLHEANVLSRLGADEEEGAFDVSLLEDVENFGRPLGVGTVVEGDGNLIGMVAVVLHGVGAGIHVHVLIVDQLLARIGFVLVDGDGALAGLGQAGDAHDVALTLDVDVVARGDVAESLERLRGGGFVPDAPQGVVFHAQTPQGEGGQAQLAGRAQLVQHGDAVEEPDHVAPVGVFVDVLEVRIERIVVEVEIGVGVGGALPCVGNVQVLGVEHLGLERLAARALLGRGGNGERPVVSVAADGADDLVFGNDFEHARQVPHKPVLAGDGAGIAGGLMLVVVHQDDAVGVGGDLLEVGIGGGDRGVDVEAQAARMQVPVELMDEGQIGGRGFVGKALKIERKAAISRVRGEKADDLLAQRGALAGILEHRAEAGIPGLRGGVEVVEVGKDFRVFPGRLDDVLDLVVVVGVVDGRAVNHGILAMRVVVDGHQGSRRCGGVKPLREKKIDLVNMLLERRVAGGVVLHVVGGTQAFAGVERNFRRLAGGFAARRSGILAVAQNRLRERLEVVPGSGQQQLGKVLIAHDVENESGQHQRGQDGSRVENAAQALPTLALGVEKYLFIRHLWLFYPYTALTGRADAFKACFRPGPPPGVLLRPRRRGGAGARVPSLRKSLPVPLPS